MTSQQVGHDVTDGRVALLEMAKSISIMPPSVCTTAMLEGVHLYFVVGVVK